MAEFRWIVTSSFLMLQVLSFRAATQFLSFTVRGGDEVTLSCGNVIRDQHECNSTTWLFTGSRIAVPLFENGKIFEEAEAKSDRLSVSEKCSLVKKNVKDEDGGQYVCRRFISGKQQDPDAVSRLHVVTMTEQKNNDEVMLSCSVSTYEGCQHRVKWLNEGNQDDVGTSIDTCSAGLRIKKSHLDQKSKSSLKCEVTHSYTGEVHQFTFSPPQSSDDAATTTTTKSTTTILSTSTTRNKSEETNNQTPENNWNEKKPEGWWWWRLIVVPVGLAALIISVVTVNIWTRTTGNKTLMEENIERDDEDEDDGTVNYENVGDPSASVSLD